MGVNPRQIVELREERALSQEQLARSSGLNLRTIQRIEKTGTASLQSQRALAEALGLDVQDLTNKEPRMSPCPECRSDEVYESARLIDTTTIGGGLVPGLASSGISSAKMRPVVCANCGYLRFFVAGKALAKLRSSSDWKRI